MSRTLHLSNGIIITDPFLGQYCHSLTVSDGIVRAIDIPAPEQAKCIDLQGQCAVPGFVDSHLHLVLGATGSGDVDLMKCTSKKEFESLCHKASSELSSGWAVGSGWSEQCLGEMPSRLWFPRNIKLPMLFYRTDFHCAVVNDALLQCLNLDNIKTMQGGHRIDEGLVFEDALFNGVAPLIPDISKSIKINRTKQAIKGLHACGITFVGTMEKKKDIDSVLVPMQESQLLRMRAMCIEEPTRERIAACNSVKQDSFLKITGFKTFLDGTLGSRTAKMYSPWLDADGAGVWTGHALQDELADWILTVSSAGYAPVLHAIGDEALGRALHVLRDVDPALVPRIEHAQCIAEKDLPSLSNKWFGVQPTHKIEDMKIGMKALGRERLSQLHNWRRMVDAGGLLSFGSDWPIAQPNPLLSMQIAIQQGLSAKEALASSTSFGAQSLRSTQGGHLQVGAFADIAVLDQDPLRCDWKESIPSVTMTIIAGRTVYTKE